MDKEFTAARYQCRRDRRIFECELDLFQLNEIRALVIKESCRLIINRNRDLHNMLHAEAQVSVFCPI